MRFPPHELPRLRIGGPGQFRVRAVLSDGSGGGDFEAAYAAEREASAHMFMTGEVLAAAIAGQFPDQFPTGPIPSDTALAPVAGTSPLVFIGLAVAMLAGLTLTRRAIEVHSRD